jgi:hypothetical protein
MSAPSRNDESSLTRRDELAVSGGALSEAPWGVAGAAGAAVTGADLLLHLVGGHLTLGGPLAAGTVALFAVAGGGVVVRKHGGRAARWARRNPWRFAVLPGAATAVVVFVLSMILGSGALLGSAFTAGWHGAVAFGLTGAAGAVAGSVRKDPGRSRG